MKSTFLFLLFFTLHSLVHAQNNQEVFLQANQAYEQNDFKQALQLYDSITYKGAAVWYNMGNCYYALENFVDALVYWRRAQQQFEPKVYHAAEPNIGILADKTGYTQSPSLIDRLKKLSVHGSLLIWQLVFLIIWVLLFILFKFKRRLLLLAANSCAVVLLAILLTVKYNDMTRHYGIINDDASLFIGPGEHFSAQAKLPKMHEVVVGKKVAGWYNVAYADGSGWVPVDKVSLIN